MKIGTKNNPESVQNDLLFKRFAGYLQFVVDAYR
jgi:hypothetical protein